MHVRHAQRNNKKTTCHYFIRNHMSFISINGSNKSAASTIIETSHQREFLSYMHAIIIKRHAFSVLTRESCAPHLHNVRELHSLARRKIQ